MASTARRKARDRRSSPQNGELPSPRWGRWLGRASLLAVLAGGAFAVAYGLTKVPWPAPPPATPPATPPGMKWIPPGEFTMGTDDPYSMANERPAHRVRVDGFWMDEHDVTNAEFRRFVEATGYVTTAEKPSSWDEIKKQFPPGTPEPADFKMEPGSLVFTPTDHTVPLDDLRQWWRWVPGASWRRPAGPDSSIDGKDDYPVVQASWDDAVAYAKWAGKRLPTEAEWERAARGGLEAKRFVWGDEFRPDGKWMANTFQGRFPVKDTGEDGFVGPSPVGSFPPNGYGLSDMAGNVWQWCSDRYRADAPEQCAARGCCDNPPGPRDCWDPTASATESEFAPRRVIKGGSFLCNPDYCESYRPSARRGTPPDTGASHIGFRCVLSADDAGK